MLFKNPYWSAKTKIELLQRWILVHSYIYYELNSNIVTDSVYDGNARQLLSFKKSHYDDFILARYGYAFLDYDVSTGFDLYSKLRKADREKIKQTAHYVNFQFGKRKKVKKK